MIAPAQSLVIVGSGLAAWTLVREFRKLDAQTPITLITRDNGDFYSKPMLSNALSSGKTAAQLVSATSAAMAHQLGVTVMAKTDVTAIDPVACSVTTALGPVTYSRLVLALGADPVRLPLQGDAADRVISVNDLQDYATFRAQLEGAKRVTVIGAGLIGCEFANDLVQAGYEVDVIDPGTHPLGRLLPLEAGQQVQQALAHAGVRFHFGTSVQAVLAAPQEHLEMEKLWVGVRSALDSVVHADAQSWTGFSDAMNVDMELFFAVYKDHINDEEIYVYPAAAKVLNPEQLEGMSHDMVRRRSHSST